ncbi:hypothetical protein AL035_16735 [Salipiger aestuarii]|uniref:Type II secretion system protein M (GspM) n=1 Tax=Salipiger aestuarii TaxID=568098 RepID=A0A327XX30_9RHOB|nr:type II secretion system protein GspM [Salipiger aestuarii]KAB2540619.1 hypothetical protein AL035_16735 [Salipiger aestuarii]RAK13194.1 type II secretion system protein M (GspM) [Salipiger aestuarii]
MIDLLLRLAPRERMLLAVAALLVLPATLGLGVLLPLADRRAAAEQALNDAVALDQWVRDRLAEQAAMPRLAHRENAPVGTAGIEKGLIAGGLRGEVSTLVTGADGRIEMVFDAVDFLRLGGWLGAQAPHWGYDIQSFRIEATDTPGVVTARLSLTP